MQEEISKQIYCNEWHFFSFQKTSTTQWHFGRYSKRKKNPTWTSLNSSYQQYKRPQFRNPTTYTIYKRLSKESLKHVVQKSSQSEALSLSGEHFILTQVKGRGKGQYLTKILHLLQFIKRFFFFFSKANHIFVLTLQEGSTDGCRLLSHPKTLQHLRSYTG